MSPKIRVSFCDGCHVQIICPIKLCYRVVISDSESILLDISTSKSLISYEPHSINYKFIRYKVDVYFNNTLIFTEQLNLKGRKVKINFDSTALGDNIAWISQVDRFQKIHQCELYVNCQYKNLFENVYTNLHFNDCESLSFSSGTIIPGLNGSCKNFFCFHLPCNCYYASYDLGFYALQPHLRTESLSKIASDMLGLEYEEIRPKIFVQEKDRVHKKPYVCIAVQSTAQYKYWNHSQGWQKVCEYLISKGYDVICIDKEDNFGKDGYVNSCPSGIINKTGNLPLQDRITDILHCDFFIGLGSGLSWLAWALGRPVILISGFSNPNTEFTNPYRVFNPNVCNSCWNDITVEPHSHNGWSYCPRKKNFECSSLITPEMVFEKIDNIIKDYSFHTENLS